MRRMFMFGVPLTVVALTAAVVVLLGAVGTSASLGPEFKAGKAAAAKAYFLHGKLVAPTAIATKIQRLNKKLDACYLSHGATHQPFDNGGFTYRDKGGAAQSACTNEQDAVNAYAESAEMQGFSAGVEALGRAFWTCLAGSGVLPTDDHQVADTGSSAFRAAADSCSTQANSSFGTTAP